MTFGLLESQRIENLVASRLESIRPPLQLRNQIDLQFRLKGNSVEIFEITPRSSGEPGELFEDRVAKATFDPVGLLWKIYWSRADGKWHRYPPTPWVNSLEQFMDLLVEDEHACFFG